MKRKAKRNSYIFYYLFIGLFFFVVGAPSYAGSKISGNEGETGYTEIKKVDKDYLTIDEGRFRITADTKFFNQDGAEISFNEIKNSSVVSVTYRRDGGEFKAIEIMLKKPPKEKYPE
jgi:hypothetical protein